MTAPHTFDDQKAIKRSDKAWMDAEQRDTLVLTWGCVAMAVIVLVAGAIFIFAPALPGLFS